MKSNPMDLRKRGFPDANDIKKAADLSYEELIQQINAKTAAERSAAIRVSAENQAYDDDHFISLLLSRLCTEKALYTRLEICSFLEKGSLRTAEHMIDYLGEIGNNQHESYPGKVSKKVSYPLPRDIIARSLGKMDTAVLPLLFDVLQGKDRQKISEAVDAIGMMVFYHRELATEANLNHLLELFEKYSGDSLIVWKITVCLSAFSLEKSIKILIQIRETIDFLREEANRSLNLAKRKMKNIPTPIISQADLSDMEEILKLQYDAYQSEARIHNDFTIQPLTQTLEESLKEYHKCRILKAVRKDKIIGSVRAYEKNNTVYIGKLMVHPDYQGKGLGKRLLAAIEASFPDKRYELYTSCPESAYL